jgi:hypothetical protein
MTSSYTDLELTQKIEALEAAIRDWATRHEIWHDSGFSSFLERVQGEPGSPAVASILYSDGELARVLDGDWGDGLEEEFSLLVESLGFEYENWDGSSFNIYARDERLNAAFEEYFRWQWICSLIKPDCGDVYEEIYSHFKDRPDDFHRLNPRTFEVLLHRVFQNQGFETELGPGSGDGGVDIRLLQRDPIGDILTLVQVKRYAPRRKIRLDAVASLRGVMAVEGAPRGLFVTTSEYLPSAKKFAERAGDCIDLKTSSDVQKWCMDATEGIILDKSRLVSHANVLKVLESLRPGRDARVVHASWGHHMVINSFAVILKETKHAALVMALPNRTITDDGYGQSGTEVAMVGLDALRNHRQETVWRATRSVDERGGVSYWDGKHLYAVWDGKPKAYNYMD